MPRAVKTAEEKPGGIYVIGKVKYRSRRNVPKDCPEHEVVTYVIESESGKSNYVDEFDPDSYHNIGDYVELPVYVKSYVSKKTGAVGYSLSVQKEFKGPKRIQGEEF